MTSEHAQAERLLAQIKELDCSIGDDMDALGRAESMHVSGDLWASIQQKIAARRELRGRLPGPPLSD
jgi:hypothetical protein